MIDNPQSLRITSDALLRDMDTLIALEEEKRGLPPADPRVAELALQIEAVAGRVLGRSTDEVRLAALIPTTSPDARPINETPRSLASVLAEWREAERSAAEAEPGSAAQMEYDSLARHLRTEYRNLSRGRNEGS
ncbi:MAG TPA: hypothetical protein VKB30_04915 [Candidatus Limnocylindrales bacterium]|nr:hypothetical protein [Candidatus Limnocylindrales bacterium]